MYERDKYPFLSGEDQLTCDAIIELLQDNSLIEAERDNYVLSILPEGAHSSYRKWKEDCQNYNHTAYSFDDNDGEEAEDDEGSLFIYSLVDVETAPLVIEVFRNDEMSESEKLEVIQAIVDKEVFTKFHNWTQRETFKDNFLSELKPALRSMIEKKLENEDFKNVEILLKAGTNEARENYEKWRASATGINIPAPVSFQDPNCFPDEMNVAILSGHTSTIDNFLSFLARMLVFRPHESVKFRLIKRVDWVTKNLTFYTLRCEIDGFEKIVRLFFIPLGVSSSKPRFPKSIKEMHAVIECSDEYEYHSRDEELPEALRTYFEGNPKVTSYICRDETALAKYDDDDEEDFTRLRMQEYNTSLKHGVLTGVKFDPQVEKGLTVLSEEVKRLFRSIAGNTPIRLKEGHHFEENDDEVFPYNEIVYKASRPFTFMER